MKIALLRRVIPLDRENRIRPGQLNVAEEGAVATRDEERRIAFHDDAVRQTRHAVVYHGVVDESRARLKRDDLFRAPTDRSRVDEIQNPTLHNQVAEELGETGAGLANGQP